MSGVTLVERALLRAFPAVRMEPGIEPCAECPLHRAAAAEQFHGQTFGTRSKMDLSLSITAAL